MKQYAANVIAENMYSQVDSEGHNQVLLDSIMDYTRSPAAVRKSDMYVYTKSGQRRLRQTTVGWKLLVRYKDGSENWVPLKVMKEHFPVQVAEFAVAREIEDEPTFAYWVPYTLRKRDRVIAAAIARMKKSTHKYGIEVPTSVEDAKRIDTMNGYTLWADALDLKMSNVAVAFEILTHK